ncbi:hypothetical protein CUMW_269300, partial [Citrus unshiu]
MEGENAKALGVPDTSANIWRKQVYFLVTKLMLTLDRLTKKKNKNSSPSKLEIHKEFQDIGVAIIEEVDVVISTVAYPQFRDQLKIDDAIKVAGNIK